MHVLRIHKSQGKKNSLPNEQPPSSNPTSINKPPKSRTARPFQPPESLNVRSPIPDPSHIQSPEPPQIQSPEPPRINAADLYESPVEPSIIEQEGGNIAENEHRYCDENSLHGGANVRNIYPNEDDDMDLSGFFKNVKTEVKQHLHQQSRELNGVKWYLCLLLHLEKEDRQGNKIDSWPHFRSKTYISLPNVDSTEHDLDEAFQKMFKSLEEYLHEGLAWILKEIVKLEVSTVQYSPIGGSSYIPLPRTFSHHGVITNIMNNDEKYFIWSVLASLHPVEDIPERVCHYTQYEHELDMNGIEYPVSL